MRPETKSKKAINELSSSGQATLEYILLLVITVGLILAFSKRFSKPYGEYLNVYFGAYLGCLLDKGVLPRLGSDEDDCKESLNFPSGNPFAPGGPKAAGSSDNNGNPPAAANRASEINEMANSRSGGRKGRIYGRMSIRRDSGSQGGDGSAKDEKVIQVPNPLPESKFFKVSRAGSVSPVRGKMIQLHGLAGLLASEIERIKRRQERVSSAAVVEEGDASGRGKKMIVKAPERKVTAEAEAPPMTFGKFVRFLIILAIILAILVFLGTQMNQISKSWEK